MRYSFYALMVLSAVALSGAAWAAESPQAEVRAPVVNPMGAGLLVPAGEAASPVAERDGIAIRKAPDDAAEQVGILQAEGSDNPYQMHVIVNRAVDPNWKPSWFGKMLGRKAPVITTTTPVSEFMLSPTQKGVMIVTVQGGWLQIAQGWFKWTADVAKVARFKPWSELYQEASFSAFQLTNARINKADIVPLAKVTLTEEGGAKTDVEAPTRFVVLDASAGSLKLRATSGTCGTLGASALEGIEGWVSLFAKNGAPQLLLQPEICPTDAAAVAPQAKQ